MQLQAWIWVQGWYSKNGTVDSKNSQTLVNFEPFLRFDTSKFMTLSLLIQLISKLSSPRSGRCGRCCCCRTAGCSTTGATGTGCCAGPGGCQADGEGGTAGGWAGGGVGHAWSGAPSDGDGFKRCGEWVYSDMLWVGVESPFELPPIREDGDPTFLGNFPVPKASWVIFFSFDMHQKVPIHWGTPPFREELVRSMRNPQ